MGPSVDSDYNREWLKEKLHAIPENRAIVAVVVTSSGGAGNFFTSRKRFARLASTGVLPSTAKSAYGDTPQLGGETSEFYEVLPGRYRFSLADSRTESSLGITGPGDSLLKQEHVLEFEVSGGEAKIFDWNKDAPPFVEPLPVSDLLSSNKVLSTRIYIRDMAETQLSSMQQALLHPKETNLVAAAACPPEPLKVRWDNARLTGKVEGCQLVAGEFDFDKGHRVSTRFKYGKLNAEVVKTKSSFMLIAQSGTPLAENFRAKLEKAGVNLKKRWIHENQHLKQKPVDASGNARRLTFITDAEAMTLSSVDGVPVSPDKQDIGTIVRLLSGQPGTTVNIEVDLADGNGPATELVVERESVSGFVGLLPGDDTTIHYPDGGHYTGPVVIKNEVENSLSLPVPFAPAPVVHIDSGLVNQKKGQNLNRLNLHGQLLQQNGHGFLGRFDKRGNPTGPGYCFTGREGHSCHAISTAARVAYYRDGAENKWPSYSIRDQEMILAELGKLPRKAAIDLLRKRWVDALMAEQWDTYLTLMSELHTLGFDTGIEALYYEAVALQQRNPERAHEQLKTYLNLSGSGGANYAGALDLYTRLEGPAKEARHQRLAKIEQARKQRHAFCEKLIEQGTLLCGCREFRGQLKGADARQCKS